MPITPFIFGKRFQLFLGELFLGLLECLHDMVAALSRVNNSRQRKAEAPMCYLT